MKYQFNTVDEILRFLRPGGFVVNFRVRVRDTGAIVFMCENEINPYTAEVIEEDLLYPLLPANQFPPPPAPDGPDTGRRVRG